MRGERAIGIARNPQPDKWIGLATDGRLQFHARVAVNVLSMVERELRVGLEQAEAHRVRLDQLGAADDADLARMIRDGSLDDRLPEVRELVWASVRDKLAVANPKYLAGG